MKAKKKIADTQKIKFDKNIPTEDSTKIISEERNELRVKAAKKEEERIDEFLKKTYTSEQLKPVNRSC